MKNTNARIINTQSHDAYAYLASVEERFTLIGSPMPEYQKTIGEMLRTPDLPDNIKFQALNVLSDLVIHKPEDADPEAVRRMVKFVIHGNASQEFVQFKPADVMTKAVGALTSYVSVKPLDDEELPLMLRAAEAAIEHGVPSKKAKLLTKEALSL